MDAFSGFSEAEVLHMRVFLPALHDRARAALAADQRFVHYTSAPAAMSVIRNRQFWLRNTQCMNDFSEVQHGLALLRAAYRSEAGERLLGFLEEMFPGFRRAALDAFAGLADTVQFESYIGSVSEHDPSEDGLGRLSMWRAYSGVSGIALVLNRRLLLSPGHDPLNTHTGPVIYADRALFMQRFGDFADGIRRHADYVAGLGAERARAGLVSSYFFGALATKHPGFAEEREWRIAHNPRLHPTENLVRSVELCRNEPQILYKLPLRNRPELGITGLDLADCLDALIIGPCENPRAARDAFAELLGDAGIAEPDARIRVSEIPIR